MSRTLLTHSCGHPVVLDVTSFLKVIAPSFTLGTTSISNLILDIFIDDDTKIVPEFICVECSRPITPEQLKDDVSGICQVCGKNHPVDSLNVHSQISIVCNSCITAMRGDSDLTAQQDRYKGAFGIIKTTRVTPLIKVLSSVKLQK